jgi:hypothetical protein
MDEEWVWMKHSVTGGEARVTSTALDNVWSNLGWELLPEGPTETTEAEDLTPEGDT